MGRLTLLHFICFSSRVYEIGRLFTTSCIMIPYNEPAKDEFALEGAH